MKYRIGILVFSVLFVILLSSVYANSSASAQTDGIPSLSGDDIAKANSIALADQRVQSYIAGKSYYLMSSGAMTNANEPGIVRPALSYNIDNKDQLFVTVDLQTGTVKDVRYYPDFMVTSQPSQPQGVEGTVSTASSWYLIIAAVAGVGAAGIAAIYFKIRGEKKLGTRLNPS